MFLYLARGRLCNLDLHAVAHDDSSEAKNNAIRCNVICPGAVDTPMMAHVLHSSNPKRLERVAKSHPIGRVGTPEDLAAMA